MSVSDPLLKDIKGCIIKFLDDTKELSCISDTNCNLVKFCEKLEKIFTNGLLPNHNAFGFAKQTDPWMWLEKISNIQDHASITYGYISSVESVKNFRWVSTNQGKLRLLIRNCLIRKCLHVPVDYLMKYQQYNKLYRGNSVLGDEILSEIFLSLLLQCSKLHFKLDLSNVSFLDKTWFLPEILRLELVPCQTLGVSVSFADDKAIIVNIKSNSIISETHKVQIGDVLDNLNGIHIFGATKGKLYSIFKYNKGKPITVTIIKAVCNERKELYKPLISLLKQVHIDPLALIQGLGGQCEPSSVLKKSKSGGFKVTYVGYVDMGKAGDIKQIDKAVKILMPPYGFVNDSEARNKLIKKVVHLEAGEIGVKLVDEETADVILQHSYMEISSCGTITHLPYYFAFIAGNEYCDHASEFTCHVFYVRNIDMVYTVLQSIGQGFQRTHFAV